MNSVAGKIIMIARSATGHYIAEERVTASARFSRNQYVPRFCRLAAVLHSLRMEAMITAEFIFLITGVIDTVWYDN